MVQKRYGTEKAQRHALAGLDKHMKYIIAVFCFVALSPAIADPIKAGAAVASMKFDAVKSFHDFVSSASEPKEWATIRQNARTQKWFKARFTTSDVKYDVRKTDSLVTPITGIVSFLLSVRQSDAFESKDDAERALVSSARGLDFRIEGKYHVVDDDWRVSELRTIDIGPGSREVPVVLTEAGDELRSKKESNQFNMLERWIR